MQRVVLCSCSPVAAQQQAPHATCSSSGRPAPVAFPTSLQTRFSRHSHSRCQATSNGHAAPVAAATIIATVGEIMTKNVICVHPDTTIDDALDLIVENKITGLPVVDKQQRVVGVVSDWDLLPLEAITEVDADHPEFFPDVNTTWTAFNDLSAAIAKNAGKTVADVMTIDPLVVRTNTAITDAAQILMKSRVRRLPVVDAEGKIEGVISRGNIIAAALLHRRQMRAAAN